MEVLKNVYIDTDGFIYSENFEKIKCYTNTWLDDEIYHKHNIPKKHNTYNNANIFVIQKAVNIIHHHTAFGHTFEWIGQEIPYPIIVREVLDYGTYTNSIFKQFLRHMDIHEVVQTCVNNSGVFFVKELYILPNKHITKSGVDDIKRKLDSKIKQFESSDSILFMKKKYRKHG